MTYTVSGGMLNSTNSFTHSLTSCVLDDLPTMNKFTARIIRYSMSKHDKQIY